MSEINVTNQNFKEEVLEANVPVLIDFWASWCGPCKMLLPIIEQIAEEAEGFKVVKINADEESELVEKYDIRSLPTLVVMKQGQVVTKSVGLKSKEEVLALLKE